MSEPLRTRLARLARGDCEPEVLFWVLLGATLLRLWFSLRVHPVGEHLTSDMGVYLVRSERFFGREATAWDTFQPPGYPLFLALLFRLFGRSFDAVAMAQSFVGGATAVFTYLLARRVTRSGAVALASAVAVSLYVPLLLYGALVLTETLSAFLVVVGAWLALRAADTGARRHVALAGLALGTAATVRANLVLILPMLPALGLVGGGGLRAGARLAARIGAWAMPLVLAACVHNSVVLGRPAGLATNGGLNFYLARAEVVGVKHTDPNGFVHFILPVPNSLRHTEFFWSPVPFYEERFFYAKGLEEIAARPSKLLTSAADLVEGVGLGAQTFWPGWRGYEGLLRGFSLGFFFLAFLPALAHVAILALQRRLGERDEAPRTVLSLFVLSALLTMALFLGDPRMRVPFDALVIVLAVDGWARAAPLLTRRGRELRRSAVG